jgi:hypothetical protein
MAELKTKITNQSPNDFLNTIEPEQRKIDGFKLLQIFEKVTGEKATMWGTSIVGFGKYHYKSKKVLRKETGCLLDFPQGNKV